jgi:hypothetical protein
MNQETVQRVNAKLEAANTLLLSFFLGRSHLPTVETALRESYVAGGAIVSLVLGEEPRDIDVWFRKESDFNIVDQAVGDHGKRTPYSTTIIFGGITFQLVKSRIGEPADVVNTFDFEHTKAFWIPGHPELTYFDEPLILSKRLLFNAGNLCHPVNSFKRIGKFISRGYTVPDKEVENMLVEVHSMPVEKIRNSGRAGSSA